MGRKPEWVERKWSKTEIDRAGRSLVELSPDDPVRQRAIEVVDNWRSCHSYPLQVIKMTLKRRAKKIDKNALIAQRLKRRPSIDIKLRDNPSMRLSAMQDIGGCRAVLQNVKQVERLVRRYKKFNAKSPKDRSRLDGSEVDYIKEPKLDGYRSVHLIFKFQSPSKNRQCFTGQRIEIQIRTRLQHLWATAVETAQVFTGQALKSKIKQASDEWLRFFALTSSLFALKEKSPQVPGTPETHEDLVKEIREVERREDIFRCLWGWNNTIRLLEGDTHPDADLFLLTLDPVKRTLSTIAYTADESDAAQKEYENQEKETESSPNTQVVLVAVEDLDALRRAYPNYYVDTSGFLNAVQSETNETVEEGQRRAEEQQEEQEEPPGLFDNE